MNYPKVFISFVPGENIFSGTFFQTQRTAYYLCYTKTSQNNINMAGVRNMFFFRVHGCTSRNIAPKHVKRSMGTDHI